MKTARDSQATSPANTAARGIAAIFLAAVASLPVLGESLKNDTIFNNSNRAHESIFDVKTHTLDTSHFTWGADVGTSIDIGGYDLSTFDLEVVLGYKRAWLRTLGVSCGVHRDFTKGNHLIPLMALVRTQLLPGSNATFLNIKAGYSFNSIGESDTNTGFMMNVGIGFNLASSRQFQTHLVLSYEYLRLNGDQRIMVDRARNHADLIQLIFGVNF